jgi:drug/metabolite transporter (DMT)-like permease
MQQAHTTSSHPLAASFAVAICGTVWGIYWLPLRYLQTLGFSGNWATAAFFIVSLPPALILAVIARREIMAHGRTLFLVALGNALVFSLYSNAYTHTTVFNVLFLFYLSPVWSVLITRFWYREPMSPARIGCVAIGLIGLVVMLSKDGGWPVPRNVGDWMALLAGIIWAIVAIRIRKNEEIGATANSAAFFLSGIVPAIVFLLLPGNGTVPSQQTVLSALPLLVGVAWLAWMPSQALLFWGARRISPVRTGMLLMTELLSGVVTAALLSGDPISWQQGLGGALILAAGVGDILTARERAAVVPAAVAQD